MEIQHTVAQVIFAQLGGTRMIKLMTGAKHFVDDSENRRANIGLPGNKCVRITLDGSDTYTVETLRIASPKQRMQGAPLFKTMRTESGVYADNLRATFTAQTGLELAL